MRAKQVTLITISGMAVLGGVYAISRNSSRKRLYNQILSKVVDAIPVQNADWAEYFSPDFHKSFNPDIHNKYSVAAAKAMAKGIRDSLSEGSWTFGLGTNEVQLKALLVQIPDGVRLSQVAEQYQVLYSESMFANIQDDLDVVEQNEIASIISRKPISVKK